MAMTREQALDAFRSDDLLGLGMEADALRRRLHPEAVASYSIECSVPSLAEALDLDTLCGRIAEALEIGATGVAVHRGTHPETQPAPPLAPRLVWYERLVSGIRQRFPHIELRGFSACEILDLAASGGLSLRDIILRLRDAGLDSIAGMDGAIVEDAVRPHIAPASCAAEDWLEVHRAAHGLGMRTTAAIAFGRGETLEQRIRHLAAIRRLQEETGGFAALLPWTHWSERSRQPGAPEQATAVDALKLLAVSRLYLSNIENLQATWTTQGLKVLQMALRFGANDAGAVLPQEDGVTEETLRRILRDAGLKPVQRDTLYTTLLLS